MGLAEPGALVRLVRRLVLGEPHVAVGAEELRLTELRLQRSGQGQHRRLDGRVVDGLVLGPERLGVVGFEFLVEVEGGDRDAGGVHQELQGSGRQEQGDPPQFGRSGSRRTVVDGPALPVGGAPERPRPERGQGRCPGGTDVRGMLRRHGTHLRAPGMFDLVLPADADGAEVGTPRPSRSRSDPGCGTAGGPRPGLSRRWTEPVGVCQTPSHVSAPVLLRVPASGARGAAAPSSHDAPRGPPDPGRFSCLDHVGPGQNEVPMLSSTRVRKAEMTDAQMHLPDVAVPQTEAEIDVLVSRSTRSTPSWSGSSSSAPPPRTRSGWPG